jgi:hypothetical protein
VHPTGGSLRVFGHFAWLGVGSGKTALSRPAHQRVTPAVGQLEQYVMDNNEAKILLQKTLEQFRQYSFKELQAIIGNILTFQVDGESGVRYQIEVEAIWDGKPGQDIMVLGAIDDGGWRAFSPLSDSFIMSPDGTFVGE